MSRSFVVGLLLIGFAGLPHLFRFSKSLKKKQKSSKVCVGVDIGGSTVKLALIDALSGTRLRSVCRTLPHGKTPKEAAKVTSDVLQELLYNQNMEFEPSSTIFVGVSVPGRVEEDTGVVSTAANLGSSWNGVSLASLIEEHLLIRFKDCQFKAKVINDASAALYGEMWSGSAAGCRDCVLLTLGTGVGSAVCSDGRCLRGATGMFGEMGHSFIDFRSSDARFSRVTGVSGILEEYCSSRGLIQAYGDPNLDVQTIFERDRCGAEVCATKVVEEYFDGIGVLVINAARCYDPSVIVMAGGVVEAGNWFMDRVKKAANARQWNLAPPTFELKSAAHGQYAGCVGAAFAALKL